MTFCVRRFWLVVFAATCAFEYTSRFCAPRRFAGIFFPFLGYGALVASAHCLVAKDMLEVPRLLEAITDMNTFKV